MPLLALGISHHTAPIDIREQVAINRPEYAEKTRQLLRMDGIEEGLILGTCNRTEIYCIAPALARSTLLDFMHETHGLPKGKLDEHFYMHTDEEAVRHLIRVAGGLESLVLGEQQIVGQLKEAWQAAHDAGGAGKILDRLFQHTFAAAKSIRNESGIGSHTVSVAYTAVVLARQIFGDLKEQHVVLVGAGDMIRLCGKHLREQGIAHLEIINRSLDAAAELAAELQASASTLDQLNEVLPRADILISSTASHDHVIGVEAVKKALRARKHRPMFMVDIAVPRDIDPAVGRLDDVYLFTIDDLQQVVDENLQQRNTAAQLAVEHVEASVSSFMRWWRGMPAADALQRVRAESHGHEAELVERALRRLQSGQDPAQVLEQLAETLTNRILHAPTQRLREAAEQQRYDILEAADWIFQPRTGPEDS